MFYVEYFDVAEPRKRYTVSAALPAAGGKVNEDVMLVQHYLNKIFEKNGGFPDGRPLAVDGRWGGRTASWVLAYQKGHRAAGDLISTDGKVSPAMDGSAPGGLAFQSGMSKRGLWYTIIWMGWDYFAATGHKDVSNDPDAPSTLRAFAAGARDTADPGLIAM